jgi:phenylacetate-coenzyme A ligase PaaK-like adenylate-forming protein
VVPGEDSVVPWEAGSEGELVLTHLDRECQLLRFRTGDIVRLTATERCGCGALRSRCWHRVPLRVPRARPAG